MRFLWPLARRLRLPDEEPDLAELEPPGLPEDLGPRPRPPPLLGRLPLEGAPRLLPLRVGGPLGRRLL